MSRSYCDSRDVLTGMSPEAIAEKFDLPLMRGKQVFQWLQKKQVMELEKMTDLPEALRASIAEKIAVASRSRWPTASIRSRPGR
jgi:adenine C2-methylase RlmN of 23S rRNA A2503 and tRNA A37